MVGIRSQHRVLPVVAMATVVIGASIAMANEVLNNGFEIGPASGATPTYWSMSGDVGQQDYAAEIGTNGMAFHSWTLGNNGFFYYDIDPADTNVHYFFEINGYQEVNASADVIHINFEFLEVGEAVPYFAVTNRIEDDIVRNSWTTFYIDTAVSPPTGVTFVARPLVGYNSARPLVGALNRAFFWDEVFVWDRQLTFLPDEIVEPFAYTNNMSVDGLSDGNGFSGSWSESSPGSFAILGGDFDDIDNYPKNRGNKALVEAGAGVIRTAQRDFTSINTGRIYTAFIMNYQSNAANASCGLSLMSTNGEMAFIGEVGSAQKPLGISHHGDTDVTSSYDLENGSLQDYLVLGAYDFSTHILKAKGYFRTDKLPGSEPSLSNWDAVTTVDVTRIQFIDGVQLSATGANGRVLFDEVRVATNWNQLLNPVIASNLVVNGGVQVTDADIATGGPPFSVDITHNSGIETTNDTSPSFKPEFDVQNALGTLIHSDEEFSSVAYINKETISATNASSVVVIPALIDIGTYTIRWSAMASNGFDSVDDTMLANGATSTFSVIDDDSAAPLATSIVINGSTQMTDQRMLNGLWKLQMEFTDASGTVLSNGEGGFEPNFSLINPSSTRVIDQDAWEERLYMGPTEVKLIEHAMGTVPYAMNEIGTWSIEYSVNDRDDDRVLDDHGVTNASLVQGTSNTFNVIDDDSVPPTDPQNTFLYESDWTNANSFLVTWDNASDASGIYQYRMSTNTTAPSSVTDGFNFNVVVTSPPAPVALSNANLESGNHNEVIAYLTNQYEGAGITTKGWVDVSEWSLRDWGSRYSAAEAHGGARSIEFRTPDWRPEGWALAFQDVDIANSNGVQFRVDFSGWFKGDLAYTNATGDMATAYLKMEYFNGDPIGGGVKISESKNELPSDPFGAPLAGINHTDWTNVALIVTNIPAATKWIRFGCGISPQFNPVNLYGYWDDIEATIYLATGLVNSATFTNVLEGTRTNWFFTVDDDDDRANDRLMSGVTNFITKLDQTPPAQVTITNVAQGPDPKTEIEVGWDPLPDAGGTDLSPWWTYVVYYTDEARDATNTDSSITVDNGPSDLGLITARKVVVSNIVPGATYRVSVVGRDRAGNDGPLPVSSQIVAVDDYAPVATNYVVKSGGQVTDGEMTYGPDVRIDYYHHRGIESTNTTGGYFQPSFWIANPAHVWVVTNYIFSNYFQQADGVSVVASNEHREFNFPNGFVSISYVKTGTWTLGWSAISSNGWGDTAITNLANGSNMTFTVVDDDTEPPSPITNVVVSPVVWTNENRWEVQFVPSLDASGVKWVRWYTNDSNPSSIYDGTIMGTGALPVLEPAAIITNADFEIGGAHASWISSRCCPTKTWTDNGWRAWGGYSYWWTNGTPQNGAKYLKQAAGGWSLTMFDLIITNWNPNHDRPVSVRFGGYFKNEGYSNGAGFIKIEFMTNYLRHVSAPELVVASDQFSLNNPLRRKSITNWTYHELSYTNVSPSAHLIRCGFGTERHAGVAGPIGGYTGYWDNAFVEIKFASTNEQIITVTNVLEGISTNWLFSVDNDFDRIPSTDDAMYSIATNFISYYDGTAPTGVPNLAASPGPDDETEISVTWDAVSDPGGAELSPWGTYRIYYTDQPRDATNTDAFVDVENGPADLDDISTTSATLSNLVSDVTYNVTVVGRDAAGNESPVIPSVSVQLLQLALTQGVLYAQSGVSKGARVAWKASTNSGGQVTKPYDVIYVDAKGFSDSLTSMWQLVQTVTNSTLVDTGGLDRPSPVMLSDTMRFYRAAAAGKWHPTNTPSAAASREVYVAKNIVLSNGHNFISLFMEPDSNTIVEILGTNLPGNNNSMFATQIEWYDAATNANPTNVLYLNGNKEWRWLTPSLPGSANDKPLPLSQGFNIYNPTNALSILVVGRIPSNALQSVVTASGSGPMYNVVNNCVPRWSRIDQLNLEDSGFVAGTTRRKSDELRVLGRGVGPFGVPRLRVWLDDSGDWHRWSDGSIANHEVVAPDEAIIIYTRKSTVPFVWTNRLYYSPPTSTMSP